MPFGINFVAPDHPPVDLGFISEVFSANRFTIAIQGIYRVQRIMLRSKIHRATLTGTELDYEGSIAIDRTLIEAAGLLPGEQVHVLNLSNAARLITYVIEAPAGSGTMMLNGPAARLGAVGDKVIVLAYGLFDADEARRLKPVVVHVDERNRLVQGKPA